MPERRDQLTKEVQARAAELWAFWESLGIIEKVLVAVGPGIVLFLVLRFAAGTRFAFNWIALLYAIPIILYVIVQEVRKLGAKPAATDETPSTFQEKVEALWRDNPPPEYARTYIVHVMQKAFDREPAREEEILNAAQTFVRGFSWTPSPLYAYPPYDKVPTPLLSLIHLSIPYALPENSRNAHMVIIAGSDRGKTQTLEAMAWADFEQDRAGHVIIDSKRDMVERLSQLDIFDPDDGKKKLIIIDPRDGPSLAPFAVKGLDDIDPQHIEEVVNGTVSEMGYFFRAMLGEGISSTMSGVFNPLVQLLIRYPGATLETLADAVNDPTPYVSQVRELSPLVRKFLTTEYKDLMPRETKAAVKRRIHGVLNESPSFARMFNAKENRLDLFTALNEGTTVLVSTETNFLGEELSRAFGRYIISQTMVAARKRAPIPEKDRKQAYLMVDEAGAYFDERTETLLRTLRSYRLGAVLAFQDWALASPALKAAIISSTSIKMIGSDSTGDANALADDMRTTPEFILSQGKVDRSHGNFALYVRGMPTAISVLVPFGTLDKQKPMSKDQYRRMRERNKAALTGESEPAREPSPSPDVDIGPSKDWP